MKNQSSSTASKMKASHLIRALEERSRVIPRGHLSEYVTCSIDDEPKLLYARYFQSFLLALNDNTDFEFEIDGASQGCVKFYYRAINFDKDKKPVVIGQIRDICESVDIKNIFRFDRISAFNELMYNSRGGVRGKERRDQN
jgi:hypothetical protein